jgi:hypothetical protein
MTLRIVPATDPLPVENLVVTVYSQPGLGKSSLAFTAGKVLLLDTDRGAYRSQNRGAVALANDWSDIATLPPDQLAPYDVIALDTAGRALDILSVDILRSNPKLSQGNGALSQRGYGELKVRFQQWLSQMRTLGKDVVLICHMTEEYKGDDVVERIDAQGSSKNEIYKVSDAICRIQVNPDGSRFLNFDPREGGYGKNPAQLPRVPFPHPSVQPDTLAKVLADIKAALNYQTEAQAEARKEENTWTEALAEISTVEQFNTIMVPLAKERKGRFGAFVKKAAEGRGYKFDKAAGVYVVPEEVVE